MPHVWLDERTDPPVFRFEYREWTGPQKLGFKSRRRIGTGLSVAIEGGAAEAKKQTILKATQVQAQFDAVRVGWTEPLKSTDLGRIRPFEEVAADFMAWGNAKGGLNGFPWGAKHAEKRAFYLRFWGKALGLHTLRDLEGCLPRVERVLIKLQKVKTSGKDKGKALGPAAGKTKNNYLDGLKAFCTWCVERGLLDRNPLEGLAQFDQTKKTQRRALSVEDIRLFLEGLDGPKATKYSRRRRAGYEVAFVSGLRAGELRALRVKHLDAQRGGLHLEPAWTKNRKPGFQPLPASLVARLEEAAKGQDSETPLVFVSREGSNTLQKDLERVGLTRWAVGMLEDGTIGRGKVDFHALRVAYTTLVLDAGASVKEAQNLARHGSPNLTMNVYGRARQPRLEAITEAVGRAILPAPAIQTPYKKAVGAEGTDLTEDGELAYAGDKMVGREGFEPP
ncbi:MAG: tyrosine-type recombinase/integrase [Planctomycetes bacterium]|nr:tyrosine-type recombinase/integrase [Planctomycetota bacterium]